MNDYLVKKCNWKEKEILELKNVSSTALLNLFFEVESIISKNHE